MQDHAIKAIVFDLGNVLIDFDHMIAARRISKFCEASLDEIYNLFFDSSLTCLFEEGRLEPEEFFLELKKILKLKISYKEFIPIWNEIFFLTPKNKSIYRIALSLKSNYTLCLASNINILHFEYLKKKFSVFDAFHKIFLSYRLNLRKPSPLFYRKILDQLSLKPQEVFYTDDRKELVEVANNLGFKGFVFLNVGKLKEDFLKVGINLDSKRRLNYAHG